MAGQKFLVTQLDPRRIRKIALDTAEDEGFEIEDLDRWSFKLTRGSKGASIVVGALAEYCEFEMVVQKYDEETTEVVIERNTPWWTGLIGVARVKSAVNALANRMKDRMEDCGGRIPREAEF
ncbi:MAG: hypothetical protein U0793_11490 [Gemmataceae bacterium]